MLLNSSSQVFEHELPTVKFSFFRTMLSFNMTLNAHCYLIIGKFYASRASTVNIFLSAFGLITLISRRLGF